MTSLKAVIGAGYGDEGKGLVTDYLCSKYAADVVVRFNGGAQAGHTVETPAGERHVFGHIASGTFTGASTFLSKHFVTNPLAFLKEMDTFKYVVRSVPDIYVDSRAIVTTPYDMLINQMAEDARGTLCHGSCGLGFGETIERCLTEEFALRYRDLGDMSAVKAKMEKIRDVWFPKRCLVLGIDPEMSELWKNRHLFTNFIHDSQEMWETCEIIDTEDRNFLWDANLIVFEGAQGLMLDQDYGSYPHVTRSNTGLKNIEQIMFEVGMFDVDVTYVTRCYTTRHGDGPLSNELPGKPYAGVEDDTNIPNKYQGSLRFAHLNIDELRKAIETDLSSVKSRNLINVQHGIAITCLDQTDEVKVYNSGRLETYRNDIYGDVGDSIYGQLNIGGHLIKSFGPTRSTIQETE